MEFEEMLREMETEIKEGADVTGVRLEIDEYGDNVIVIELANEVEYVINGDNLMVTRIAKSEVLNAKY